MLAVFNVASTIFGIPLLYVYIFVVWTLLTACMAYVVEKKT